MKVRKWYACKLEGDTRARSIEGRDAQDAAINLVQQRARGEQGRYVVLVQDGEWRRIVVACVMEPVYRVASSAML